MLMAGESPKNRLGRGLAALIGEMDQPIAAKEPAAPSDNMVAIENVRANPNNPRQYFSEDDLRDLSNSIREHGIVQPILVRPVLNAGPYLFEIIAGERRWRAAQLAELHSIPIIIREVEDKQALEIAIVENVQRSDLNPIEEAAGYQQLIDEHQYSQNDLAQVIGKSRSHVAKTLRLLKLPDSVCAMVSAGTISAGHARALVTAPNPEELANLIARDGLSVRQIEALMQGDTEPAKKKPKPPAEANKDADTMALERSLSDLLGMNVGLVFKTDGTGEVKIQYQTLEQLDDICRRLQQ
jgi:ParB family chromosome partitioning protein